MSEPFEFKVSADKIPQPIREDGEGATDPGPRDILRALENPNMLVPPETDAGTVPNLRFSFSDTHMTLKYGGWSRQISMRELPVATTIAGVNMRLTPGGVRELHWHKEIEFCFMTVGSARITAVDQNGKNFIADVGVGDLWYLVRSPFFHQEDQCVLQIQQISQWHRKFQWRSLKFFQGQ